MFGIAENTPPRRFDTLSKFAQTAVSATTSRHNFIDPLSDRSDSPNEWVLLENFSLPRTKITLRAVQLLFQEARHNTILYLAAILENSPRKKKRFLALSRAYVLARAYFRSSWIDSVTHATDGQHERSHTQTKLGHWTGHLVPHTPVPQRTKLTMIIFHCTIHGADWMSKRT